ncbi:MAG: M23 family metallopeptidase [Clostridia bacterium]|nr:M23 family metallopeptidase [Clostridia bacterium]
MKNSFIIGIVWTAIIVCLVSFTVTVFFWDDTAHIESENVLNSQKDAEKQIINYETNESSIRTNDFFSLNKESNLENLMKVENEKTGKIKDNSKDKTSQIKEEIEEFIDVDIANEEKEIESLETASNNTKSFIKPVKGNVIKPLATNELIFSKTLNEWNIHNGVDYEAKLGDEVYAIRDGKIKKIDFDYIYGNYIIIEHDDGYESLCSNITVLDALQIGDNLKQGDVIGYVAESFGFEAAEDTHVHFELKKNGVYNSI